MSHLRSRNYSSQVWFIYGIFSPYYKGKRKIFGPCPGHTLSLFYVWHARESHLYTSLPGLSAEMLLLQWMPWTGIWWCTFGLASKLIHSLSLHCSSLLDLQLCTHQHSPKSAQHQCVFQHSHTPTSHSSSSCFRKDQMCSNTSVPIVSARLFSPSLQASNPKYPAWLTPSQTAVLRGNMGTLRIIQSNSRDKRCSRSQVTHRRWSSLRSQQVKVKY